VATLIDLRAAGRVPAYAAPRAPQNFSSGSFDAPHAAQRITSAAPHSAQKRRAARLSHSHDGQGIEDLPPGGPYHNRRGRAKRNAGASTERTTT
jgi:hypothetical protein